MTPRRWLARLIALVRARRLDRELEAEMQAHLELAERDALARGLSPDAARRDARLAFGAVEAMKERHRDARSARWVEHLVKDTRHAVASLRREPLFTTVAAGVLALGIGANTAVFSLVNAVLLSPMPFPEPDRIVRVWESPAAGAINATTTRTFLELKRQSRSFSALSAESLSTATVPVNGEPTRLNGRYVSWDHFEVFGIQPLIGRTFREEEDVDGAERVVIISHAAWQQHFGADPGILGRDLLLDNEPHRVIGVLPPGAFDRHAARPLEQPASFWRLNAFAPDEIAASMHWLAPVGRLKPGVTLEQARADVLAFRARIADLIPGWKQQWSMSVEPYDERLVGDELRQSMYVALGAVALVLLIACANITNLLLARNAARRKEMAVRAALGATRGRIATQVLTETLALGLLGGAMGIALAAALLDLVVPLVPGLPFTADVSIDVPVLAFATVTAIAVSLLAALLPAIRTASGPAAEALNVASRGSSAANDRVRRAIVAAEVAVSVILICGGVLLFKSLERLQQVDIGARIDRVLTMAIDLPYDRYPTGHHRAAFYPQLIERLEALPSVASAAISGDVPLEGTGGEYLRMPGSDELVNVRFKRADPRYFDTLGIEMVSGRTFTAADRAGAPYVAVVNETLARRLQDRFGLTDPIGRAVDLPALGFERDRRAQMTIVGIVRNEHVRNDLRLPMDDIVYVPIAQAPRMQVKLAVRTHGDPASVMPEIRSIVRQLDPHLALADVRTMDEIWQRSLAGLRQPVWLIGIFAAVSATLAALGLYGVVAHTVSLQRREIGIRMALGARPASVAAMVVRNILVTIAVGLVLGLGAALAMTRLTRSLLFEVSALDPAAFTIAAAAMAGVGLLAALIPALRATRVDPTTTLRAE